MPLLPAALALLHQGYAPPLGLRALPPAPAYALCSRCVCASTGSASFARSGTAPCRGAARVLRGFLVAYGSNPIGDFWPLASGRVIVGRAGTGDGVDVAVQDPTISSRHAALVVDPEMGGITVEDTGSTNGTFVNDEHIGFNGRRELRDGDRVRFGGYITVVKVIGRV